MLTVTVSKQTWCLTSTEPQSLWGEGGEGGAGEGGMEVDEDGNYIRIAPSVITRMTHALRWATMRAILMFCKLRWTKSQDSVTDHNFLRERRAEADSHRGHSAYQPNAIPLGQTGSRGDSVVLALGMCLDLVLEC